MFRFVHIAKGIGIILVVMWHLAPEWMLPEGWLGLRFIAYKFHMPLFMFLSGYLFLFDARGAKFLSRYGDHLKKKARRLVLPYFSVSLGYAVLKTLGQPFFAYHPITLEVLENMFVRPLRGPANLLWFVYVLAMALAFLPLLQFVLRSDVLVFLFSLGMFFLPGSEQFASDRFFRFFSLFVAGWLARRRGMLERVSPGWGFGIAGVCFVAVCMVDNELFLSAKPPMAFVGAMSGLLACVFLSMLLDRASSRATDWLTSLGEHSATIYLMHQPFTWFMPVLLFVGWGLRGNQLLWVWPLALLLGLAMPMLIERFVISRSRLLSLLILGTSLQRSPDPETRASGKYSEAT
jgi:fucose 4-O-acetylase-like acetyltransferase